jgi:hypothetical protein
LKNLIYSLLITGLAILAGCTNKLEQVPEEQFVGEWTLKGRSMFEGMVIEIKHNDKNKLIGRIKKLNENKYVQMFADSGDIWISEISRNSNFQFKLTEKKIARELFGLYGLGSSTEFKAEFIDKNIIGISSSGDPSGSSVIYERIE